MRTWMGLGGRDARAESIEEAPLDPPRHGSRFSIRTCAAGGLPALVGLSQLRACHDRPASARARRACRPAPTCLHVHHAEYRGGSGGVPQSREGTLLSDGFAICGRVCAILDVGERLRAIRSPQTQHGKEILHHVTAMLLNLIRASRANAGVPVPVPVPARGTRARHPAQSAAYVPRFTITDFVRV